MLGGEVASALAWLAWLPSRLLTVGLVGCYGAVVAFGMAICHYGNNHYMYAVKAI